MYEESKQGPQEPPSPARSGGNSSVTGQTPPPDPPGAASPSEAAPQAHADSLEYLEQIEQSADRALAEAEQASFDIERLEIEFGDQRRRGKRVWAGVGLLAAALLALSWYSFPLLQQRDKLLTQLPSLQKSVAAVGKRVGATEEQLNAWSSQWDGLEKRVGKLQKTVSKDLSSARKAAQEQASQVYQQMMTELDNRTEWMKARLSRLESNLALDEEAHRVQLAQLHDEIAAARREMNQQMAQARQESRRDVAALGEQIGSDRRDLDALAQQWERRKVDFELPVNQNRELVPEVALTLTATDVGNQQADGWLRLLPESRTLWVRGQGIQQPIIFYTQQDSRPLELVFTRITENGAVGYLLVPERAGLPAGLGSMLSTRQGDLRLESGTRMQFEVAAQGESRNQK